MATRDDSDFLVSTTTEFNNACNLAEVGDVIWAEAGSVIDVTPLPAKNLPEDVTIASNYESESTAENRDPSGAGATIRFNQEGRGDPIIDQFRPITIEGLHFHGPSPEFFGQYDSTKDWPALHLHGAGATVSNCTFFGFPGAALWLGSADRQTTATVTNCEFVGMLMSGAGYGVNVLNGMTTIDECYFNYTRHAIAGFGHPTCSYEAQHCLVGANTLSHAFDMHALVENIGSEPSDVAGGRILIHDNQFLFTRDIRDRAQEAVAIRGIPDIGAEIHDNEFLHESEPQPPGGPGDAVRQARTSGGFENLVLTNNAYGVGSDVLLDGGTGNGDSDGVDELTYSIAAFGDETRHNPRIPNPNIQEPPEAGTIRGIRFEVAPQRFARRLHVVLDQENSADYTTALLYNADTDSRRFRFDVSNEPREQTLVFDMTEAPLPPGTYDLFLHDNTDDQMGHATTSLPAAFPLGDDSFSVTGGVEAHINSPSTTTEVQSRTFAFKSLRADVLSPSKIASDPVSVDIRRTHTALSSWKMEFPFNRAWETDVFNLVEIRWQDELLFRGYLENVESDESGGTTTLSGRDLGATLPQGSSQAHFINTPAHDAVWNYIENNTGFTANLTTPSTNMVAVDEEWQDANTEREFDAILTEPGLEPTDPVVYDSFGPSNEGLRACQIAHFTEGEHFVDANLATTVDGGVFSNGRAVRLNTSAHYVEIEFETEYEIPPEALAIAWRGRPVDGQNQSPELQVTIDGHEMASRGANTLPGGLRWHRSGVHDDQHFFTRSLDPGTHRARIDATAQGSGAVDVDAIVPFDHRYRGQIHFDNSVDVNGYLEHPRLFPTEVPVWFDWIETPYRLTNVRFDADVGGTAAGLANFQMDMQVTRVETGGQIISVTDDDTLESDIQEDFTDEFSTRVRGRVHLGATPDRRHDRSPTENFRPYVLEGWNATLSGDDLGVIHNQQVTGDHLENIQRLCDIGNLRFVVGQDHNIDVFRQGDNPQGIPDWHVIDRKRRYNIEGYANRVTVYGAYDGQFRVEATIDDDDEIEEKGRVIERTIVDPSIELDQEARSVARSTLRQMLQEDVATGDVTVSPTGIDPGFSYAVRWGEDPVGVRAITHATVPAGTSLSLTLQEDLGDTGTIDNEQTRTVPNGRTELDFERLFGGSGNRYDGFIDYTRSNVNDPAPSLDALDLDVSDEELEPTSVPLEDVSYSTDGADLKFDLARDIGTQFTRLREDVASTKTQL